MNDSSVPVNIDVNLLPLLFDSVPAHIFFKDTECRYQYLSRRCYEVNRRKDSPEWTIIGKTDKEIQPGKKAGERFFQEDKKILATGKGCKYTSNMFFDGYEHYFEVEKQPVFDSDKKIVGIIGVVNDITELTQMRLKAENAAFTDGMTGLRNRKAYEMWKNENSNNLTYPFSIIVADCDCLKLINDNLGHEYGDMLLNTVSSVMQKCMEPANKVFRIGGDEFIILCERTHESGAAAYIEQMQNALKDIFHQNKDVSVSMGAATIADSSLSFEEGFRQADQAMLNEKQRRKLARKRTFVL